MINGNTRITKLDLEKRGLLIIDSSLDEGYQKDLNSPFMKRKMAQAIAFLDEHGLPEGWGEWKKQIDGNKEPVLEKVIDEKK